MAYNGIARKCEEAFFRYLGGDTESPFTGVQVLKRFSGARINGPLLIIAGGDWEASETEYGLTGNWDVDVTFTFRSPFRIPATGEQEPQVDAAHDGNVAKLVDLLLTVDETTGELNLCDNLNAIMATEDFTAQRLSPVVKVKNRAEGDKYITEVSITLRACAQKQQA